MPEPCSVSPDGGNNNPDGSNNGGTTSPDGGNNSGSTTFFQVSHLAILSAPLLITVLG